MNNKLEDYDNIIKDKQIASMVKSTSEIINDSLSSKKNRQIHVNMFKTYYADYFKSKFNNEKIDTKLDENKFREWMYISGGPFREVDLLDDKLNVVDTVPSYYLQPKVSNPIDNIDHLVNEFEYYNKKKDFHKEAASNRIKHEANQVKIQANNDVDRAKHRGEWNRIISKYSNPINIVENDISKKDIKKISDNVKNKLGITSDIIDDIEY